jgi:hypothetical protein
MDRLGSKFSGFPGALQRPDLLALLLLLRR